MPGRHIPPSLSEFYDKEEEQLGAKLEGLRLVLSHAGEKGRALEYTVIDFFRNMLPAEYGLTCGFIASSDESGITLSPQLDIVIYDAIRYAPLVTFGTCSVLPLEAVYGYIEVKATLNPSILKETLTKNRIVRQMINRNFWESDNYSPPSTILRTVSWLPVRSFLFSFESSFGSGGDLANKIQIILDKAPDSHLHGIFMVRKGFFSSHNINENPDRLDILDGSERKPFFAQRHALTALKIMIFKCLATFPRYHDQASPAVDRYHSSEFLRRLERERSASAVQACFAARHGGDCPLLSPGLLGEDRLQA